MGSQQNGDIDFSMPTGDEPGGIDFQDSTSQSSQSTKFPSSKKNHDVAVVGSANFDYLIQAARLPLPGETIQGKYYDCAPGGKGANQAIAVARFGGDVVFIAKIGSDAPAEAIQLKLYNEGVNTHCLLRDEKAPSGVALISVDDTGEKQITEFGGANLYLSPQEVHSFASYIQGAKVLLVQLEISLDTVQEAVNLAYQSHVMVILDPAPAQSLSKNILQKVNIIKPNATEAEILTQISVRDRNTALQAAKKLIELGVKVAIVQAGKNGDLLLTHQGEELWLPRLKISGAVDATGAGDAFLGVLACLLAKGKSLKYAAHYANAAAALKTRKRGAQAGLPTRKEIEDFLNQLHPPWLLTTT